MHVLHIGAGNMYGGVETVLVTLAHCRRLCPAMEPVFALCFEGRLSRELTEAGVPVHLLGEVRTRHFWTVLRGRRVLRRLLREQAFDVVVTHTSWVHAIFAPEVRSARVSLANWVHAIPTGQSWLEKWARRAPPELAICNSRLTADSVRHQFGGSPAEVLYLPVATHTREILDRTTLRKQLGVADDTVVILQVSRMEAWKGHRLHLEALAKLKDLQHWVCLMAGGAQRPKEHEYLTQLQRRAAALGISDRVQFLGQRSDVSSLLAAADVFCQPNEGPEPFGIVFIEALSAGLPVVSTNMGGAAEILDESCGVLTPPGDAAALAKSLRQLIESSSARRALGEAGPRRADALCNPADQLGRLHQMLEAIA